MGDNAFYLCTKLTSVTLPDGIASIGTYAFAYCYPLASVNIPDSVKTISSYAFSSCYGLKSIELPKSVTTISNYAFYYCAGLTSITFTTSVTSIGIYAFSKCQSLTDVYFAGTESEFDDIAIGISGNSYFTDATIHCTDSAEDPYEPDYGPDGDITFDAAASTIAGTVRAGDTEIEAVYTITNTATSEVALGYGLGTSASYTAAFTTASTGELVIPATITSGGTTYTVTSILQGALSGCAGINSIVISEGIHTIAEGAFEGCYALYGVSLPTGIEYLRGNDPFADSADLISISCADIESAWVARGLPTSYGDVAISFQYELDANSWITVDGIDAPIRVSPDGTLLEVDASVTIAFIPEYIFGVQITAISGTAFANCSNLTIASIPSGVTAIEAYTFAYNKTSNGVTYSGGTSLTQVYIPDSVTSIGSYAFYIQVSSGGLEALYVPSSVTYLGTYVTSSSTFLHYGGSTTDWSSAAGNRSHTSSYLCYGFADDEDPIFYTTCPGVSGGYANVQINLATGMITSTSEGVTVLGLPEYLMGRTITGLAEGALDSCYTTLTTVSLPSTITTISETVFDSCINLSYISYLGTQADWENKGFSLAYNGTTVTFSDEFDENDWLTVDGIDAPIRMNKKGVILEVDSTVTIAIIPSMINGIAVSAISADAFKNCGSLVTVSIPETVTEIAAYTFMYGTLDGVSYYYGGLSLKNVSIPDSIVFIGNEAFFGSSIASIYIPSSVKAIGQGAVSSVYLNNIYYNGTQTVWDSITSSLGVCNDATTVYYNTSTEITLSIPGAIGGDITFDFSTGIVTAAEASITTLNLPSYLIGHQVVGVAQNAFADCANLTSITLTDTLISIGTNAFANNGAAIYFFGTQETWDTYDYTLGTQNTFVLGSKEFVPGEDNNGYWHSSGSMGFGDIDDNMPQTEDGSQDDISLGEAFVARLTALADGSDLYTAYFNNLLNSSWGGSCYGVTSTIALAFGDYLSLDDLSTNALEDGQDTYYELDIPAENAQLYNTIMYYQIGQLLTPRTSLSSSAKPLLDALDKDHVVVLSYGYSTGGHAILALGYEQQADGSYIVTLYDENQTGTSTAIFFELTISADYQTYSFTPVTGPTYQDGDTTKQITLTNEITDPTTQQEASSLTITTLDDILSLGFVYDSEGNFITDDSASTASAISNESDTMLLTIASDSAVAVTLAEQTFFYQDGSFSGDMSDIQTVFTFSESGSEWVLTVPATEIVYVENLSETGANISIAVFSSFGTLTFAQSGVESLTLDLYKGTCVTDAQESETATSYMTTNDTFAVADLFAPLYVQTTSTASDTAQELTSSSTSTVLSSGDYTLTQDITGNFIIDDGATVNLSLNGYTITGSTTAPDSVITIIDGTLNLYDTANGTITGSTTAPDSVITI